MELLREIAEILTKRDYFIILGHIDPDGDCIGSVFALKWGLDILGKKSLVLLDSPPDDMYDYLEIDNRDYRLFKEFEQVELNWPEVIFITIDTGDRERLGDGSKLIGNHLLINIDHHPGNPEYGKINYVDPEMAAAGEIIYDLLNQMNLAINRKVGTALATAIIADTGGLRYQNTTARVYRILADLIEIGVDTYQINKAIYGNYSYESVKLKGLVLSTLALHQNKKIAWIKVEQSALKETGADINATSGLVNYPRDIKGVEVGLAFIELEEEKTRVSFRSNNYCPVNEIAAYFGGGGHVRAAGCIIDRGLKETIEMVLSKVEEYV
ncbi:MAG: bifunctional oligoribonuclease and phosphatase NrnA [Halanaerobiales bacterium]|nr:bifunctional oligoribonuclease and phosphatase NrnA [Halanaerobiales bacterium]